MKNIIKTTIFLASVLMIFGIKIYAQTIQQPQLVWDKSYGGAATDVFKGMTATHDGGYAIIGLPKATTLCYKDNPTGHQAAPT